MSEPEYICVACGKTYNDGDTYCCTNCGELLCPKCGGEIVTNEEYDKTMKENSYDSND